MKSSYNAWVSYGFGDTERLAFLLSFTYRWEVPLQIYVALGGSTHKGLFLVLKPVSGPWVSLGQGNGM